MFKAIKCVFLIAFLTYCSHIQTPTRLYFIHIPKTGGTSLHSLLENQINLTDLYPPRRFQHANRPVAHEYVSGHFPYWFCHQLDKDFEKSFKITILRDPIERYLSLLRYKKKNFPELGLLSLKAIHEKTKTEKRISFDSEANKICMFLASDPTLTGKALLEDAKKNLHKFDFVLFLDNFKSDMLELCQLIHVSLDEKTLPHLNRTNFEDIDPEFLATVQEHNALDIELYAYAKKNLKRKGTQYRFLSKTKSLSKIKQIDYEFSMPLNGSNWCYRENVDRFSPEYPIFRWVMDKPAKIRFDLKKNRSYHLEFTAQCLTQDITPHVLVNGVEIPVERKDQRLFSKYRGIIPKGVVSDGMTEITFYSPVSYRYNEVYPGYSDNRKLSFAVDSIKIFRPKIEKKE